MIGSFGSVLFIAEPGSAVEHVIHISVDGLGGTGLQALINNSPATYPNIIRLQNQGLYTYNARTDYFYTETIPDHTSIITGRPTEQPVGQPNTVHHGYVNNFPLASDTYHDDGNPNLTYIHSTFDVVHDRGLSTSLFKGKTRMDIMNRSYDATNGGPDTIGADNGRDKIDGEMTTNGVVAATLVTQFVTDLNTSERNYAFIHIVDPDLIGHNQGWYSPAWIATISSLDGYLGTILNLIDNDPEFTGNTAIVMTGDHGGFGNNHVTETNIEAYTVPFFAWGPGIPSGNLYNFTANRFDPGPGRPDYNAAQQPVRNGDSANLAMSLLGLPNVPGSSMSIQLVPEPGTCGLLGLGTLALFALRRRQ
jgi:hypothetical protein